MAKPITQAFSSEHLLLRPGYSDEADITLVSIECRAGGLQPVVRPGQVSVGSFGKRSILLAYVAAVGFIGSNKVEIRPLVVMPV